MNFITCIRRFRVSSIVKKNSIKSSNILISNYSSLQTPTLSSLLSKDNRDIIKSERLLLDKLAFAVSSAGSVGCESTDTDLALIADTKARIDDLFLVVVVGEFNSGKSSLINALLGDRYLREGPLPTTNNICLIRCSNDQNDSSTWRASSSLNIDDVDHISLPIPWLKNIAIVDTPGTNALDQRHQTLTKKIIPLADLVLFVTSSERPISQSEANFLSEISQLWGRKIIIIINKIDLLPIKDRKIVIDYVHQSIGSLLGYNSNSSTNKLIPIFPISSKLGLDSRIVAHGNNPELEVGAKRWIESNINELEKYLENILKSNEIIHSKLENPLIICDRIISKLLTTLDHKQLELQTDNQLTLLIDDYIKQFHDNNQLELSNYIITINKHKNNIQFNLLNHINKLYSIAYFVTKYIYKHINKQDNNNFIEKDISDVITNISNDTFNYLIAKVRNQSNMIYQCIYPRAVKYNNILSIIQSPITLTNEIELQILNNLSNKIRNLLDKKIDIDKDIESVCLHGMTNTIIGISICWTSSIYILHYTTISDSIYKITSLDPMIFGLIHSFSLLLVSFSIYYGNKEFIRKVINKKIEESYNQIIKSFESIYSHHTYQIERRLKESSLSLTDHTTVQLNKVLSVKDELLKIREIGKQLKDQIISKNLINK